MDADELIDIIKQSKSDDELLVKLKELDLTPELLNSLSKSTNPYSWIGFAPIHWTMFLKFTKSSYYLFEKGTDVNIKVENCRREGWTPLFYAVSNNDLEMVKYLLERGGDVTCITRSGNILDPLFYYNKRNITINRFQAFMFIFDPDKPDVQTLLATLRQDHLIRVEILNLLLSEGIDVNVRSEDGASMFIATARLEGDYDTLYPLVNEMIQKHSKCLRTEIDKNDIELFTILVRAGFTIPFYGDTDGITELMYLTESRNLELIKLFILMGQDPDDSDDNGKTALSYAFDVGDFKTCEFLKTFQYSLAFESIRSAFLNRVDISKLPDILKTF